MKKYKYNQWIKIPIEDCFIIKIVENENVIDITEDYLKQNTKQLEANNEISK